jgi:hypothetical protein
MLLVAAILMWIAVISGLYQRIFIIPKWFKDPPVSFDLIRKQNGTIRSFWIILSALIVFVLFTALYLNWHWPHGRTHIIGGIVCFMLTGILGITYFIREIMIFSKIPGGAGLTPDLQKRIKRWLSWSPVRDLLLILAALFVSIAYNHA